MPPAQGGNEAWKIHLFWVCVVGMIFLSRMGDTRQDAIYAAISKNQSQVSKIFELSEQLAGDVESCKDKEIRELADRLFSDVEDLHSLAESMAELIPQDEDVEPRYLPYE